MIYRLNIIKERQKEKIGNIENLKERGKMTEIYDEIRGKMEPKGKKRRKETEIFK